MHTRDKYRSATGKGRSAGIPTAYIVIALVIPLVLYLSFSAGQRALEVHQLNQQASLIRSQVEALEAENARLREQIEYLRSDGYVEKVAREELNLIKPGDRAVVVLAAGSQKESDGSFDERPEMLGDTPNWRKWWNFFFGKRP